MADEARSMTDKEIVRYLESQTVRTLDLHMDLLALRLALVQKGLLTEAEIDLAGSQVSEQRQDIQAKAMRKIRSLGTQ